MATFSVNEASKLFKKSRNTIDKLIKSGELSKSQDGKGIEFSELLRVFGEPVQSKNKQDETTESNTLESHEIKGRSNKEATREQQERATQSNQKDIELAVLRERVSGLESLLAEREKLVALLEYKAEKVPTKTEPESTQKPIKKTLWQKIF